jgi:two-component system nitrogen regulation response regulator GlnG
MSATASILICDDDAAIRTVVTQALRRAGHRVTAAASLSELRRELAAGRPDVLVTDVVLPDGNGLDFVATFTGEMPDVPVIVLSAQNTLSTAVRATEAGAFDYLPKPFDLNELLAIVSRALMEPRRKNRRSCQGRAAGRHSARRALAGDAGHLPHAGAHDADGPDRDDLRRERHRQGTGGAALHDLRPAAQRPVRGDQHGRDPARPDRIGAFRPREGRLHRRCRTGGTGRFEQAEGGTLFLDEIGDMPMEAQTRLLRVLQQGEYTTVGGRTPIKTDVRIVAATNKDLRTLIVSGPVPRGPVTTASTSCRCACRRCASGGRISGCSRGISWIGRSRMGCRASMWATMRLRCLRRMTGRAMSASWRI